MKTWNQNINTKWGCGHFDILFTHYGLTKIWDELPTTKPLECDTLLVVKGGDCNLGQCVRDTYFLNGNITLVRSVHHYHRRTKNPTLPYCVPVALIDKMFVFGRVCSWYWIRYANELVELYSYVKLLEEKNAKYTHLSKEELSTKFEFQLYAHVPDTSNEWDFYPLVRFFSEIFSFVMRSFRFLLLNK